jgi:hypothetical protein
VPNNRKCKDLQRERERESGREGQARRSARRYRQGIRSTSSKSLPLLEAKTGLSCKLTSFIIAIGWVLFFYFFLWYGGSPNSISRAWAAQWTLFSYFPTKRSLFCSSSHVVEGLDDGLVLNTFYLMYLFYFFKENRTRS